MPRPQRPHRLIARAGLAGLPLTAVLLAGALSPTTASAQVAAVRVGAGSTTIILSPSTRAAFDRLKLRAAAIAPATAGTKGVALPILRGQVNTTGVGTIDHAGGLRFSAGGRILRLTKVRVNLARTSSVTATAGGRRVKVFNLAAAKAKTGSQGAVAGIVNLRVRLTSDGAAALNRTAGRSAFRAGQSIGTAATEFLPPTVRSSEGRTKLTPAGALAGLGVGVAPVGPATAGSGGVLLPITSSTTATRTGFGRAAHSGGVAISLGGRTVQATALGYRLDVDSVLNATVGGQVLPLAALDTENATFAFTPKRGRIEGVAATLTARSAAALNAAFGTTAFAAGQSLGRLDIEFRTAK